MDTLFPFVYFFKHLPNLVVNFFHVLQTLLIRLQLIYAQCLVFLLVEQMHERISSCLRLTQVAAYELRRSYQCLKLLAKIINRPLESIGEVLSDGVEASLRIKLSLTRFDLLTNFFYLFNDWSPNIILSKDLSELFLQFQSFCLKLITLFFKLKTLFFNRLQRREQRLVDVIHLIIELLPAAFFFERSQLFFIFFFKQSLGKISFITNQFFCFFIKLIPMFLVPQVVIFQPLLRSLLSLRFFRDYCRHLTFRFFSVSIRFLLFFCLSFVQRLSTDLVLRLRRSLKRLSSRDLLCLSCFSNSTPFGSKDKTVSFIRKTQDFSTTLRA